MYSTAKYREVAPERLGMSERWADAAGRRRSGIARGEGREMGPPTRELNGEY